MSNTALAGNGAAAATVAMAQAIKASSAIVRAEPPEFQTILSKTDRPLLVAAERRIFRRVSYRYLTAYKGLAFFAQSKALLPLPSRAEIIEARNIWIPS